MDEYSESSGGATEAQTPSGAGAPTGAEPPATVGTEEGRAVQVAEGTGAHPPVSSEAVQPSAEQPTTSTGTTGDVAVVKKKINVHKRNNRGEMPLHLAARKGEYERCVKLLNRGAPVNGVDYAGWTPLHEACSHGHFEVAELLIAHGADIHHSTNQEKLTPLHDAAHACDKRIVWLLLKQGADKDCADDKGNRPIDHCEYESGATEMLRASDRGEPLPERCPTATPPSTPGRTYEYTRNKPPPIVNEEPPAAPLPSEVVRSPPAPLVDSTGPGPSVPPDKPISIDVDPMDGLGIVTAPATAEGSPEMDLPGEAGSPSNLVINEDEAPEPIAMGDKIPDAGAEPEPITIRTHPPVGNIVPPLKVDLADAKRKSAEGSEVPSASLGDDALDEDVAEDDQEEGEEPEEEETKDEEEEEDGKEGEEEEPECRSRSREPSAVVRRSAVWRQARERSSSRTASPDAYDFLDVDRGQSEDRETPTGRGRGRRGRGGSRGGAISALARDPTKKSGRGRRRGRGTARGSCAGSRATSPVQRTDVYEFTGSPDHELQADAPMVGREASAPPSWKRMRLNDDDADLDSTPPDGQNEDVDMDDAEANGDDAGKERGKKHKVPILRISLKTPSEEDHEDSPTSRTSSSRGRGRGRGGWSLSAGASTSTPGGGGGAEDAEDTARLTRSKVRQTGARVEEPDYWGKKKKRTAPSATAESTAYDEDKEIERGGGDGDSAEVSPSASERPYNVEEIVAKESDPGIQIMLYNCKRGYRALRKRLEERWTADLQKEAAEETVLPIGLADFHIWTGDYPLGPEDSRIPDRPPRLPDDLCDLWIGQEKDRDRLISQMNLENARTRMTIEREYVIMYKRRRGQQPKMTISRFLMEQEICNSMYLNEPQSRPEPMELDAFLVKMNNAIDEVYAGHCVQADALQSRQMTKMDYECRRRGVVLTKAELTVAVPRVPVSKIEFDIHTETESTETRQPEIETIVL